MIEETVYKIRHTASGRYSNGGTSPHFTRTGKTWRNLGALKQHLRLAGKCVAYRECELVVITRKVIEVETVKSLDEHIDSISSAEKNRRAQERERQETRDKADRRKLYEKLREEFGEN